MALRTSLPSSWDCTFGSSFARSISSASESSTPTSTRSRTLPFTWTTSSKVSTLEHGRIRLGPRRLPQPLAAEPPPELFGDVGGVGLDQADGRLRREAHVGRLPGVVLDPVDLVHELEQGRDRRVELEAPQDVVA